MGCFPLNDRGVIRYIERAQQINDFSGLRYGNITPTDIDGLIEYRNKAYIFFEIKYMEAELPFGQRLAMERMVCDTSAKGKRSIALIAEHGVHDVNKSVPVAQCQVREYYHCKFRRWMPPKNLITVRELVDLFVEL